MPRATPAILLTVSLSAAAQEFESQILPLLETHCSRCHAGPDAQASLDVRSRASLLKGGRTGPAIVPGKPAASPLLVRVRNGQMPLGGKPLPAADAALIASWIAAGAPARNPDAAPPPDGVRHWAFVPPQKPAIPRPRQTARLRNAVDHFIQSALEKKNLSLSAEAAPAALLRRLTFDLTGLPPTPAETAAFVADSSDRAYEGAVDRLLSSPRYGERWARQWLDAAGYAESEGVLAADVLRPDAYRYRDYVIRALNADKPYDEFVREQLAGDELSNFHQLDDYPPRVVEQLEATGFLRTAVDATREDFQPRDFAEYQWRTYFDTQQIAVSALMGLTIQCARCHDHKYEPLTQRDYYSLLAVFAGAIRPNGPVLPSAKRSIVDAPAAERRRAEANNKPLDAVIKALRELQTARLAQYRARHPKGESATEKDLREDFPDFARKADDTAAELKDAQARRIELPTIRVLADQDAAPPVTHILRRGDPLSPGDPVEPGAPRVLGDFRVPPAPPGAVTSGRRLAFARWLTRPDHPLTARVIVNRIWAGHFGRGIVATIDNFGRSGAAPTHPELLDWLALDFVAHNWSLKHLHKRIVMSAAYRQSAAARLEGLAADPENLLLWRMSPRRLEAEAVRDAILAVAGQLDERMYGESVKTETKPSGEVAPVGDEGPGRRSLYHVVRRSAPQSLLNAFDAPVMEVNCSRRAVSTTATQALALMNGDFVTAQARHFARRVLAARADDAEAAREAFRLALGREPTGAEADSLFTFLRRQAAHYAGEAESARRHMVFADLCQALLGANEFLYID